MSAFAELGNMEKAAMAAAIMNVARPVARNLLTKGVWSEVGRGGAALAARSGAVGKVGQGIAAGAGAMGKASPYLAGYGLAGMAAPMAGFDLPGSELALGLSMPGWGAAMAAPSLIRSGRLATGNHNQAIAGDARAGAQQAGYDWLSAMQQDPTTARDPNAYQNFYRNNGYADSPYLSGEAPQQPSAFQSLGNAFRDPTGLVIPQMRSRIHSGLQDFQKQGSEMEKEAFANFARQVGGAAKGAWGLSRASGGNIAGSAFRAGRSAMQARPGSFAALGTAAFGAPIAYDAYQAAMAPKPYDEGRVQMEGYDAARAGIQHRLAGLNGFERAMLRLDPSLAAYKLDQFAPGTIQGWEQQTGQQFQPGLLGRAYNGWNNLMAPKAAPNFYSADATGKLNYL